MSRNGPLLMHWGQPFSNIQSSVSPASAISPEGGARARPQRGAHARRLRQLDQFVQNSLAGHRPNDGYFVEFWRALGRISGDRHVDRFSTIEAPVLQEVYDTVKASALAGGRFPHRARQLVQRDLPRTRRYEDLAKKADFLKVVVYNNCAGGAT